jgi:anti-anti-sigma regulatory factor
MAIQQWSEQIMVVELDDDPLFSDEILTAGDRLGHGGPCHVVVNLTAVTRVSPPNIMQLMLLWEMVDHCDMRLKVCGVSNSVWSAILVSEFDKFFEFSPDVPSALTSLQLES